MLNRSASLTMSASVLKALPGKLDIKRHSPSILYIKGLHCYRFGLSDVIIQNGQLHQHSNTCNLSIYGQFLIKICSKMLVLEMLNI